MQQLLRKTRDDMFALIQNFDIVKEKKTDESGPPKPPPDDVDASRSSSSDSAGDPVDSASDRDDEPDHDGGGFVPPPEDEPVAIDPAAPEAPPIAPDAPPVALPDDDHDFGNGFEDVGCVVVVELVFVLFDVGCRHERDLFDIPEGTA